MSLIGHLPDIYIVGLGIVHVDQITREAEQCMEVSNEILFVERGIETASFLRSKCPRVSDLTELYSEGGDRQNTYRKMAAKVIEAALEHPPITFALYGHPLIYAYPPFLVREMAFHLGLTVKILPGISAMDCIFADLAIDPSANGIQMYEATDLLIRQRHLESDVATLIWQIGALETGLYSVDPSRPERFRRFKTHLLKFFPKDHVMFAVHSSSHPLLKSQIFEVTLSTIESFASVLHAGFSLYIPPIQSRPAVDLQLAAQVSDPSHLITITTRQ